MVDQKYFEIYEHLQDDLSREIFLERLKFSFCGGFKGHCRVDWIDYLRKSAPSVLASWDNFIDKARNGELRDKDLYIFGASEGAKIVLREIERQNIRHYKLTQTETVLYAE